MAKKENMIEFDLSILSYQELIEMYKELENFLQFLETQKLEIEKEEN